MSLRDPSQWSEKECWDLSRLHMNNIQVEKKRNCCGNYFNEKEHSVSGLYIILSLNHSLMSQKGMRMSFDGMLCTSVKAYFWKVQSAFRGLSHSLFQPLCGVDGKCYSHLTDDRKAEHRGVKWCVQGLSFSHLGWDSRLQISRVLTVAPDTSLPFHHKVKI